MKTSTKLTKKNKAISMTITLIIFMMSLAIYIPIRMITPSEYIDDLNNIIIVLLLLSSLISRVYPSENREYQIEIYTIVFTTIISASLIDFKKSEVFSIIMVILTIALPFTFSYICTNTLINKQKSNMIDFMDTYKKRGVTPDSSSVEYKRLHSAYNIMCDYIIRVDNAIKAYDGDDNFVEINIENDKDERKIKDRYNVFMRYYLEKGYNVRLITVTPGISKIKISW